MTTPLVFDVGEIDLADIAQVGGKAASLGELVRAGAPVPPACVVATAGFHRALEALDPGRALRQRLETLVADDHDAIAAATGELRDKLAAAELPGDLTHALSQAYQGLADADELGRGQPGPPGDAARPVAVRSSATSEDSAQASFAGVQDTFLWVRGAEAVTAHVARCWASLYNVESVAYRRRMGLAEADLGMAVVVQRMVDARASGVMFTRSPTSGDPSVVAVECAWGLGSAVVSGEVTPDHYVVSKPTGEIITRRVSPKARQHRMDPSGAGVLDEAVAEAQQTQPCISDDELAALVALAKRVERHYGTPQDIEFAIAADPRPGAGLFILQSRPETVWGDQRRAGPSARPAQRPHDHVLAYLSRGARPGGTSDRGKAGW